LFLELCCIARRSPSVVVAFFCCEEDRHYHHSTTTVIRRCCTVRIQSSFRPRLPTVLGVPCRQRQRRSEVLYVRCVLHVVLCRVPLNNNVCSAWSCVVCRSSPSSRYSLSGVVNFHRDNSATACTVLLCAHVYQSCDGDNSDLRSPCVAVPFNCAVVPYIISVVGAEFARNSSE
jgi:hypothetical protein